MTTDDVSIQRRSVVINVEAAATTTVPAFLPAKCIHLAAGWSVRTMPPGTTGFSAGTPQYDTLFAIGGDPLTEIVTSNTGFLVNVSGDPIDLVIKPDFTPSDDTGEIVFTIWYIPLDNVL